MKLDNFDHLAKEFTPEYDGFQTAYASPVTQIFQCKQCKKIFKTSIMGYADPADQICPDCKSAWKRGKLSVGIQRTSKAGVKDKKNSDNSAIISHIVVFVVGALFGILVSFAAFLIMGGLL